MRYSVIVPVYKAEVYLDACVQSVLAQSVSDWELILVDDGSPDASGAMADAWAERDGRISVLHQENRGQFFARQAGIDASKGDYLLFLDSDDSWEPNCLATLDSVIQIDAPDMILFEGKIMENGADSGRVIGHVSDKIIKMPPEALRERLLCSSILNSLCVKAFRRELFTDDHENYEAFTGRQFGEDKVRLLVPVTRANHIVCLPNQLYRYFYHNDSVVRGISLSSAEKMLENEMFTMLRKYLSIWGMDTEENRDRLDAYYLKNYLSVYFNLRKATKTASQRSELRMYPWKEKLYMSALRFRTIRRLTARDRLRLLVAVLRL